MSNLEEQVGSMIQSDKGCVECAIFNNFVEYWHFVKYLSKPQRDIIFENLSINERIKIEKSYNIGGWEDLFMRDTLDVFVDRVKKKFNYNLLSLKARVLSGKSVYIPGSLWDYVLHATKDFDPKHKSYILGGIKGIVCKHNKDVVVLLRDGHKE